MKIQLQELIEQIKHDGVEAAEKEAADILASARAEAQKIISDARADADAFIANAKAENERFSKVSEDAIRQAGRNVLISFRESAAREISAIAGEKVSDVYSEEGLVTLISKAVEAWTKNPDAEDISVLLGREDLASLEGGLLSALKAKLSEGVTLKPSDSFDRGFRIALNGGSAYYDYSAESVTEMLSTYLNPRVTAIMKEACDK